MEAHWSESGYLLNRFIEAYMRSRGTAMAAKMDWALWLFQCEREWHVPLLGLM